LERTEGGGYPVAHTGPQRHPVLERAANGASGGYPTGIGGGYSDYPTNGSAAVSPDHAGDGRSLLRTPMARTAAPANPVDQLIDTLRRDLGGARVIAFANPKGGVHKTTACVLTAATLGSARGKGVLAWDDNELRGTLGLRAGTARHARTVRHLIGDLPEVEAAGPKLAERLDEYLRYSADGSFDVLSGDEDPRVARKLDPEAVRRILDILTRTHEIVCVDTGNNVESPNWLTVLHSADQLVVTTVPREDAAFSADWMLDLLHEEGLGKLVQEAITLISCPTPNRTELHDDLVAHFSMRTKQVVVVPYDPALESGSMIEYSALHPATRMAWLRAAAAVTEKFVQ
jgi:MinD-like ATPase involved in chromosome partitioning or flagellar assembly